MKQPASAPVSRGYANYVLGVLFVVYVFNFIDRTILGILIGPIKKDLGISDTVMGLLAGPAFAVFYTLAGIPIARWADRGARSSIVALSLTVWSGMTALSGLAQNVWQFAAGRIGVGIGEAGGSPPSHSLISDYFPPEKRATALALYGNGVYVGTGLAFIFGGQVATHADWRMAYIVLGILGVPLALLVRLTVRELPRGASEAAQTIAPPLDFRQVMRFLFGKASFRWLVAGAGLQAIAGYGVLTWCAEFFVRVHQMSRADVGTRLGLVVMLAGCLGIALGGWWTDRLGALDKRWYMRLPAVVSLASLPFGIAFALAGSPAAALLAFGPFYAVTNMYVGPLWSTTQSLARPEMRATASALLLFILNIIGLGGGVFAIGWLNDLLRPEYGDLAIRYSLVAVIVTGSLASLLFWRASHTLPTDLVN